VAVKFSSAQTAGDLIVVVAGWNDSTATVASVSDTSHNAYALAGAPTVLSGFASQSIYYAKNIAAAGPNGNTVTVTFATAAAFPDIRILEYKGADLANPVDVTASGVGTSASSSSAAATTTNPTDLILGANLVETTTSGPGTGFTRRLLTSPDGDIAEDESVSSVGSYSATAPLSAPGRWIMQMVAFRTPTVADTTPPTAPSNLTATATSSQIALSWTASTDNVGVAGYRVERCQGTGCTTFTQIASPTATSYTDTGLTLGSYSYRVLAVDAAGNKSAYSNVATASITDTTPPTAPTGLSATASGNAISLGWTASTDNVGVTGYLVERCLGTGCTSFVQIAISTTTSYTDSGLSPGTYSYRVRATDAAGNLSPYSAVAGAVVADTQSPTAPGNLTGALSGSTVNLSWTASTDNVGVTGYLVERCLGTGCTSFVQIATPTTT
jgi:fibronectin type 3 domain-containing protein